jgi:hypothetical protein
MVEESDKPEFTMRDHSFQSLECRDPFCSDLGTPIEYTDGYRIIGPQTNHSDMAPPQDYSRFRLVTAVVDSRDECNFWKLVTRVITLYKDMYHYNESIELQFNQSILSFYSVLSSFMVLEPLPHGSRSTLDSFIFSDKPISLPKPI